MSFILDIIKLLFKKVNVLSYINTYIYIVLFKR